MIRIETLQEIARGYMNAFFMDHSRADIIAYTDGTAEFVIDNKHMFWICTSNDLDIIKAQLYGCICTFAMMEGYIDKKLWEQGERV